LARADAGHTERPRPSGTGALESFPVVPGGRYLPLSDATEGCELSVEILTRPDGTRRYKVRWREAGRNRARSFDRRADAQAFDRHIRALKAAGGLDIFNAGEQTLADYANAWWRQHAERNLGARTREVYAVQLDKRVMPALGGYQLRQITPGVVAAFDAKMQRDGAGNATRVKALTVLQSILKHAVLDGVLRTNPVQQIDKPSQRRDRQPVLIRPAQVEAIRTQLPLRDATLVSLLAYSGLRPESEAITLTWTRVRDRSILIPASRKRGGRERSVRLLEPLADDLAAWREHSTGRLVFPAGTGGDWQPHDWKNWQRRVFRPAALAAGLPDGVRARDLRGSFATLLIFEGRNIAEVAGELGHSPEVALRDYISVIHEFDPSKARPASAQIAEARAGHVPNRYPDDVPVPPLNVGES
jgi:integrase